RHYHIALPQQPCNLVAEVDARADVVDVLQNVVAAELLGEDVVDAPADVGTVLAAIRDEDLWHDFPPRERPAQAHWPPRRAARLYKYELSNHAHSLIIQGMIAPVYSARNGEIPNISPPSETPFATRYVKASCIAAQPRELLVFWPSRREGSRPPTYGQVRGPVARARQVGFVGARQPVAPK